MRIIFVVQGKCRFQDISRSDIRAGIHNMLARVANGEDSDRTVSPSVRPNCQSLFGSQLVFKILEHLPYFISFRKK